MKAERQDTQLPEVTTLTDARGPRPENAVGVGGFWYEPEVWSLPLSPASKVLYAGLCSYLAHGQINRRDLRNALKDRPDGEIAGALVELVNHGLLVPTGDATRGGALPGYEVRSVGEFDDRVPR